MYRPIVLAFLLVLAAAPAATSAGADEIPAWLAERLAAEGFSGSVEDLVVERTMTSGGATSTFVVPLSALPETDPFGGARVEPPGVPDILVGELTMHLMVQSASCAGYGAESVAPGISAVEDASWDTGVHFALGPVAGGVAASTGGDPVANLILIAGGDRGMSAAAGDLVIQEDRIRLFGVCLLTLGSMSGTGAWFFS